MGCRRYKFILLFLASANGLRTSHQYPADAHQRGDTSQIEKKEQDTLTEQAESHGVLAGQQCKALKSCLRGKNKHAAQIGVIAVSCHCKYRASEKR